MTSKYKIIIKNLSSTTGNFYAFQAQASFAGITTDIMSSSLAYGPLAPNASSGAQLNFSFDTQNYVGTTSNISPSNMEDFNARISLVNVSAATSQASAIQPIDLTTSTPSQVVENFSALTVSPLGLSAPTYQSGLQAGCFGVQIPPFSPSTSLDLYCGCASINQDGSIILSSFISPNPNSSIYCSPTPIYYVKFGDFPVGSIISYSTSNSAICDFSTGNDTISVQYNANGTFTVTPT
ncbi:MAG: hypothetical protein KKC14_05045 [Alphaproteobacteria bacterium]|nr:hypothetical protein [Alphaproteobacteria bacterium]